MCEDTWSIKMCGNVHPNKDRTSSNKESNLPEIIKNLGRLNNIHKYAQYVLAHN